jgi:hypothetical protein
LLLETWKYAVLNETRTDKRVQTTHTVYFTDSSTAVTKQIRDYADRLAEQINPDSTRQVWTYEPNGNLKSYQERHGQSTYYIYDGLNRQTGQWTPVDITNGSVRYAYTGKAYDNAGNLLTEKRYFGLTTEADRIADIRPTTFIRKTSVYYPDGKLQQQTMTGNSKTEYYYSNLAVV